MPRRASPFVPDSYYHFYNRGNNRQAIFFEPANYLYFLRGMKRYLFPLVSVVAYCLMPTHYHLLVKIRDAQASEVCTSRQVSLAMQKFLISYTKAINKRFSRVGALFQGQFQAKPVESYGHLLALCAYIHTNPVKDGLVAMPEDWPYANYLEWIGERKGTLVEPVFIAENFRTPVEYRTQVMNYINTRCLTNDIQDYLKALE